LANGHAPKRADRIEINPGKVFLWATSRFAATEDKINWDTMAMKVIKSKNQSTKVNAEIMVYTDGSALGNPGPGGYAFCAVIDGSLKKVSGSRKVATNNQMELKAIECALRTLPSDYNLLIHSDSQYAVNGCTSWLSSWIRRSWNTSSRNPVANSDLWKKIDRLQTKRRGAVRYIWIRGHSGNEMNELVDRLARRKAQQGTSAEGHHRSYKQQ
jgi:ribonuclease HI